MVKQFWDLRDPEKITESQTRSMLGDFGSVSKRFQDNTKQQDYGAECFEFDMETNGIKKVSADWNWMQFEDCSGAFQQIGADPFNFPIPNVVAFMWNVDFFNPDYFVCYWTQNDKNSPFLKNKFVEVKGSSSIKNEDLRKYQLFQKRIDKHNEQVKLYAKPQFRNRCLLEFEIFIYPNAYGDGTYKTQELGQLWTPTLDHIEQRKIYTVEELTEKFYGSDRSYDIKSRHIFDPKKVKQINPNSTWSDRLFKKYI